MGKPTTDAASSINPEITKHLPRKIRNGADLWASFDDIDEMLADERVDVKRAMVKVMNNRQRVDFLKLAVRAGALKQNMLALPDDITESLNPTIKQ